MYLLPWFERPKLTTVIDEHKVGITHSGRHIRLSVAIDVIETKRDNGEVFSVPYQGHGKIHLRVGCVSPGKLDDFNAAVQVDRDKMAGCFVVFVPDPLVNLEGTRAYIGWFIRCQ